MSILNFFPRQVILLNIPRKKIIFKGNVNRNKLFLYEYYLAYKFFI